ncbi:Protein kinase-like protein [Gracilaria domingensis]|nr:Protein kinase-like protein [Gracilaria domingensis]
MAPSTREAPDPNALISTILTHLPSFRNKPDIATAAFQTIRRASQTSSVQQISTALLVPLTALSLNSTSAAVRYQARSTCVLLLRCLVLRRLRNFVAAYVEDVVKLAYNIVGHENNQCILCSLPYFNKVTTESAGCSGTRPGLAEEVLHLPISSVTLEALLHLLALLIPSSLSTEQVQKDTESEEGETESFSVEAVTSDAVKLWNCIGPRAQAKVLNLASSQALLSGQCGYEVANAAVHVLERAFDPAACYVVPPHLKENLRTVVNDVLRDSYIQQKEVSAAQPVRAGLYRLCQLSDPDGRIDGITWSECGIREAALPETDLGLQLRSFSKSGLVHSYVLQSDTVVKKDECSEPPTKKRRVGNNADSSSVVPERTLESGDRTQNTASDYQRMTVHGLFKSVKALPSTDVCAKHPQSLLMLANACCLAADSICNISVESENCIESIREWLSFASSLSQIGQDVVGNGNVEFENRPLGALAVLARGCLRLGLVLMELKSCLSQIRNMGGVNGTEFVDTTIMALLSVVLNAYTYGSVCDEHAENPYPALQFAELIADIMNALRAERIESSSTIEALKTCCERFMYGIFSGTLTIETKCIVLPTVLELSRYQKVFDPGVPIESTVVDICNYISNFNFNSTQRLAAGCLSLLGQAICFKVKCVYPHEIRQSCIEESFCGESPRLDEHNWNNVFTSLRKLRGMARDDVDISEVFNCVGLLCIHSPRAREKMTLELFSSFMQGSTGLVSCKIKLLPVLLARIERLSVRKTVQADIDMEDPDGLQTPGSARKEKVDHYAVFGRQVKDYARKFMTAAIDGREEEMNRSCLPVISSLLWSSRYVSMPQILGLVVTGLLARTITELNPIAVDESMCKDEQSRRECFLEENIPCTLSAWNHVLVAASAAASPLQTSHTSTSVGYGQRVQDQDQDLNEKRSLCILVCDLVNPRIREALPHCLKKLLDVRVFSRRMEELVGEGSKISFWVRVARHTVVHLLKAGDRSSLVQLAEKVEQPIETLVERASADALAVAFMTDTSGLSLKTDGSNGLIIKVLDTSLEEIVRKRFGKIVQRLVMEFGGAKESAAKHGLVALSAFMPNRQNMDPSLEQIAGVLITNNFMLVMDAVNRGFFNTKTTVQERRRHLRMLEVVLALTSDQLHLFVPKVMATLKMALDVSRTDNALYVQTLNLWKTFLRLLGPQRLVPHLGTVFAILFPVRYDEGNLLLNELKRVITSVNSDHVRDKPSLLLLLRIMKQAVLHDRTHLNQGHVPIQSDRRLSIEELYEVSQNVESIIGRHDDECVAIYASRYLLRVLRSHRHILNSALPDDAEEAQENRRKELGVLKSMLETLLAQLSKTKNVECQDVLVQCIGEIGAVDPGLLAQNQNVSSSGLCVGGMINQRYPKSVHGFASVLLNEFLVTALRKGEKQDSSKSQFNRVGLVIQELLRVCGCKKSTVAKSNITSDDKSSLQLGEEWESVLVQLPREGKAKMFWESLSSATRDAVQPYLAVPFDVNQYCMIFGGNAERSVSPACQPVWSKVRALVPLGKGVTAQEWIRQITVQLVDFIGRQGQFGELLKALRPILRYEDQLNNYIFPLVVAKALDLQHSFKLKEVKEFIIREIKEVLKEATSPQPVFDLLDTLRGWRDRRAGKKGAQSYTSSYTRSMGTSGGQTSSRKRTPMEKFMDLSVVDDPLTSLVDLYGRESSDLSLLTQAQAALASRSNYRAIMLAEYHIRNTRTNTGYPGWPSYIGIIRGRAKKSDIYDSNSETKALEVLQEAFANIEDVPNMEGIAKLRLESRLTEAICDSEAAGKYDEALSMYEHALANEPRNAALHNGFLSCLMTLGHWETMLSHAEGLVSSSTLRETELRQTAKAHGLAAAWRLGRWEKLEDLNNVEVETSASHANEEQAEAPWRLGYTTNFANMLLCFRNGDLESLEKESSLARRHLIQPLLRAARESYHRTYPIITLVHTLCEAEDAALHRLPPSSEKSTVERQRSNEQNISVHRLIREQKRIQCTSKSLKVREPLLSSRRVLFGLLNMPDEAARAHIELAKLAKEGDNLKAASASALRALWTKNINSDVINAANMESARIRRAHGDVSEAVLTAKREIDRLRRNLNRCISQKLPDEHKNVIQEQLCTALVLAGTWSEETRYETSERILRYYQEATKYGAGREEPFYALGKHFDSLLQAGASADYTVAAVTTDLDDKTCQETEDENSSLENYQQYVPGVIRSFAKALSNGHTRMYEALPRMLTVWFDFHSALHDHQTADLCLPYEQNVQAEMRLAMKSIPSYMWVPAIPQLMSRILHPRMEVRDSLRDCLASIVANFPDQSFWMILPSSQLRSQERKKATVDILSAAVLLMKKPKTRECREHAKLFKIRAAIALDLIRLFVNICLTQLPKELRGKKEKCIKEFSGVRKILRSKSNPMLIIPTLHSLTVQLPDASGGEHRPFAAEPARIADLEDEVLVMSSLMRPRRISLIGTDGLEYRYLAKRENQGDMRKDSRMVEFLTVVNRLLAREEGSRGVAQRGSKGAQLVGIAARRVAHLPSVRQRGDKATVPGGLGVREVPAGDGQVLCAQVWRRRGRARLAARAQHLDRVVRSVEHGGVHCGAGGPARRKRAGGEHERAVRSRGLCDAVRQGADAQGAGDRAVPADAQHGDGDGGGGVRGAVPGGGGDGAGGDAAQLGGGAGGAGELPARPAGGLAGGGGGGREQGGAGDAGGGEGEAAGDGGGVGAGAVDRRAGGAAGGRGDGRGAAVAHVHLVGGVDLRGARKNVTR